MLTPRSTLTRRVLAALDASPSRIPVLLGGCGIGRSTMLHQLRERIGRTTAQYVDVDRSATTPERFFQSVITSAPFAAAGEPPVPGARPAFDAVLSFLTRARAGTGEPATFLLDEFLEVRTFESFPGLRRVLQDLLDGLSQSSNRFVLTSRYTARTLRLLRDRSARFEVIHMPALTAEDAMDLLDLPPASLPGRDSHEAEYTARVVHALTDGRPAYVRAIAESLAAMREQDAPGRGDVVSVLAGLLSENGALAAQCRFSYELRLHRARGYGALKAILDILADEENLTLTEISHRLQRTPGSTKDYLSWLEDVDLVTSRQKRYSYADPLMRVWVRLHCRPVPVTDDELAREVHRYAMPRLPHAPLEPALVLAGGGTAVVTANDDDRKEWGIIEID